MKLSNRLDSIEPSQTFSIANRLLQLKKEGCPVIAMNLGEASIDTPINIASAGIEAIHDGHTRYTPIGGTTRLKKAIINKFIRDQNTQFEKNEILVSSGSKQSISNALLALLNVGDEVIIPAPYWSPYPSMVRLASGNPVIIQSNLENDFKMTPDQLEAAITPKTKLLIINNPNNPSGVIYTEKELIAIGETLKKYPYIYVISDDVYEKLIWSEQSFHNLLSVCPDLRARIITINSVSKSHAMTGWRIGYAAADERIIEAMHLVQSQTTSCPCAISQYAAREALECDQQIIEEQVIQYQEHHNFVMQRLGQIEGIQTMPSDGTFYIFPSVKALLPKIGFKSDEAFCRFLLDDVHVGVVPGSFFGSPGHIRLNFAIEKKQLTEAMDRIQSAIVDRLGDG
ncbi:MAG: pyridoxal phosphate-dependent aminotransferase [Pseudomonadota bacterium]|nr:pyridoxal phosphate-dependent aminotransferase [Pseudomonadota bacterium]